MGRKYLTELVAKRPVFIIAIILVITIILGYGISKIKIDTDLTDDIPDTIPAKKFYDEVGKIFPANDFSFIAVYSEKGVFSINTLDAIKQLTEKLQQLYGIKKVISIYNAGIIKGTESGLIIEKPLMEKPINEVDLEKIQKAFLKNDLTKSLISEDLKSTAIIATLKEGIDDENIPLIIINIKNNSYSIDEIVDRLSHLKGKEFPISKIFKPTNKEDIYTAKVNYLVDLKSESKRNKNQNILIIPERNIDITFFVNEIKRELSSYNGVSVIYRNKPIPSYYRIKNAVSLMHTDETLKYYISGTKTASTLLNRLLMKDLSILFPIVILVITLILYLSFHTFRGVFLPLLTVIFGVIWAMGIMGLLGQTLSMATMVLPIILIAVGTAYTIHVINRYYHESLKNRSRQEAIVATINHVRKPIFLAGITTMIGFGSLGISRIGSLRMFGILSALGIASALILSLSLAPAILVILPRPKESTLKRHSGGFYVKFLRAFGQFTVKHRLLIIIITVVFIVLAVVRIPEVKFETNTVNSFKKNTEIRQSTEFLNSNFSGITVMKIIVKTRKKGEIYNPKNLEKMDKLQQYLEALRIYKDRVVEKGERGYTRGSTIVGGTQSIVTFIKGINKAVHGDNEEYYKVPPDQIKLKVEWEKYRYIPSKGILEERDSETGELLSTYKIEEDFTVKSGKISLKYPDVLERIIDIKTGNAYDIIPGRKAVSNYILLYSNAGNPEDIESFVDNNVQTAQINVFIKSTSSSVLRQIQEKTRTFINEEFYKGSNPGEIVADITGLSNLILTVLELLVKTLVQSILMSLGIILIMISILSKSIYEGIISIIPIGVALIINFGVMGWFKIPLDMSTATIASIAIGIGIDYTIHFIEGYRKLYKKYGFDEAVIQTDITTGKGIMFNGLAVAGGFFTLVFSQIRGNVYMGSLMALIMITSSIGAITILPSLLSLLKPGFIRKNSTEGKKILSK